MDQAPAMTVLHSLNGTGRAQLASLDRAQWEAAVRRFGDYSYRQTWSYGVTLASRRGAVSEHVAVERGGEIIGLADVRIKRLPMIGGGLAYISGGPLVGDDVECLEPCVDALVREYVDRRGFTLRILPPVVLDERNRRSPSCSSARACAATDRGEHYRTVLLDVDRPLDEIRSSFHRHWRRHLNGAERNELEVTFGTDAGRFERVAEMSEALRARKGFALDLDARFFAEVQAGLKEQDRLVVGLVLQDGAPVAGNITAIHGDAAVYLVGASTDAALETKASYLMHWRTIALLQERCVPWYDLGGIDPVANPGVTSFKLRTNGVDVTAAGPYERAPEGMRGRVSDWAERAYVRAKRAGA